MHLPVHDIILCSVLAGLLHRVLYMLLAVLYAVTTSYGIHVTGSLLVLVVLLHHLLYTILMVFSLVS